MGEMKLAVRSLLKSKLFAAVAVFTLAIGIGATTAVFSVFDAVALRPLPFAQPDRLVDIEEWSATELCGGCAVGMSRPMLADVRERAKSFSGIGAYTELPINVGGIDAAERVSAAEVSGNFFNVLGLQPSLGRGLDVTDDRADAPAVAVISSKYFNRRLGGDRSRIGRPLRINGTPTVIVGVMPPNAVLPEFAQVWMPMRTSAGTDRSARETGVIARLKDGVSPAQAEEEIRAIAAELARTHPETQKGWTARVRSLRSVVGGNEISIYGLMLGAVLVLWAVVCANLAGLLLARGVAKRREIAVRLALGAGRRAIVWHLFAESVCISIIGGVLGAVSSAWAIDLLLRSLDTTIPSWLTPSLDGTVLGFCFVLSATSATAFGLLPALRASRPRVHDDLKAGGQNSVGTKSVLRGSLVVLQLSLSMVLLAVSGLITSTILSIASREGNEGGQVVQARLALLGQNSSEQITTTVDAFVSRLGGLAEARSAAASGSGFIAGFGGQETKIRAEGVAQVADGVSPRFFMSVTPRYFETTETRLVEGRSFADADRSGSLPVAIIGTRLAVQLWPGTSAIGHRIKLGADSLPWRTIVGVLAESPDSARAGSRNIAYVPFAQAPTSDVTLLVAARNSPTALIKPVRDAARAVNADLPVLDLMTSSEAHTRVWSPYKAYAMTISTIGGLALLLACIGLYGVVAYAAEQRTREIGVRIALGAQRVDILQLVTGNGIRLISIGLVLGLAAAAAVAPLLRNLMFGLNPFSVPVFAASAGLLGLVALFASYLPAHRAARTDPMVALRSE